MKKTNLFQDALERQIQDLLAPYPDPMGRTDFRKACRIGTRTSLYLLQSGLVPCENTGKQTRCYKIAKADVAAYLRRRLAEPAYYTPPSGWYKNYPAHKPPAFSLNGTLLLTDAVRQRIRRWYERLPVSYTHLKLSGISLARSSALAMAPFMPNAPSVSTSSAP